HPDDSGNLSRYILQRAGARHDGIRCLQALIRWPEEIDRGLGGSGGSTQIEYLFMRKCYPRESAQSVSSAFYSAKWSGARPEEIDRGLGGSGGSTRIEYPFMRKCYPRESAQSVSSAFYSARWSRPSGLA